MSTVTSTSKAMPLGTWVVDPSHSKLGFALKHMGIATVRGEFTEFDGTLEVADDPSAARGYGTVTVQSVDTNQPQRDEDLRSAHFFDAAQYPQIRFESTGIEALDDEKFAITGNLTIRGVTNEIVLHGEVQGTDVDPSGNQRVELGVTGELSRGDYGLKFDQALGRANALVGDDVKLELDISAIKQA